MFLKIQLTKFCKFVIMYVSAGWDVYTLPSQALVPTNLVNRLCRCRKPRTLRKQTRVLGLKQNRKPR